MLNTCVFLGTDCAPVIRRVSKVDEASAFKCIFVVVNMQLTFLILNLNTFAVTVKHLKGLGSVRGLHLLNTFSCLREGLLFSNSRGGMWERSGGKHCLMPKTFLGY